VQELIADRDEELAAVLAGRKYASERLHLLEEANGIWKEMAGPGKPQHQISLMRSDCKLSDAELASNDLVKARRYADLALPLLKKFNPTSRNLFVLRELGFCDESLGNLQRGIGLDPSAPPSQRGAALAASHQWYQKSADVWAEWSSRGVATPESERERRKVERLLSR
jgi:eukaryotic-like serine/threonine-protein kinase